MSYNAQTGKVNREEYGLEKFMPDPTKEMPKRPDEPREGKSRRLDYTEIVPGKAAPGNEGGRRGVRKAWKPKGR